MPITTEIKASSPKVVWFLNFFEKDSRASSFCPPTIEKTIQTTIISSAKAKQNKAGTNIQSPTSNRNIVIQAMDYAAIWDSGLVASAEQRSPLLGSPIE